MSGVTISFLSQVERNIASPSIKSLRNIAFAIGTKASYILDEDVMRPEKIELIKKDSKEKIILQNGDSINLYFGKEVNQKLDKSD